MPPPHSQLPSQMPVGSTRYFRSAANGHPISNERYWWSPHRFLRSKRALGMEQINVAHTILVQNNRQTFLELLLPLRPIPAPASPPISLPGQGSGSQPQTTMSGSPPQYHTNPHQTHQAQNTYTHQPYPCQPQTVALGNRF